ncbi:MAG: glycine dehydrogenase (aminomethyl-transferring) [Bacteroidetes bacterium GWF2_38_335]|nr:MAG: glycine dehydrogenase (aminomethyl-transferring) [Bacteroidetes bacterium GWF2_38_335]OFY80534.1 MAG: glycine dehydrogenase (aminomethyl-transferring) [Bacteroidetes bacterium RIFOXYA12_FULL_38_20]HBS85855.1 glycine dehydrogenase (aminomethyl-transferring) [Bacteroidales bacterium]
MATDKFIFRHNGPREEEVAGMLKKIGVGSMDELIEKTVPSGIRLKKPMNIPQGISEYEYLRKIKAIASKNKVFKSYIGLGYYDTISPSVIIRNILENPSWYTSYTPYQAEISQGRLEALLNYQTVVMDLTGMAIANASLLDEATSASEAMIMMYNARSRKLEKEGYNVFFVDENIFPQTLAVIKTKAEPLGIELKTGKFTDYKFNDKIFGAIVQYPNAEGEVIDYKSFADEAHSKECMVGVAADLMSLVILTPPGEWGADIVFGTTQRFGIPMGFGGPHAAFFATHDKFKRSMPGRIIGVSVDAQGNQALRMALQTREQHIKRERATSNICTAQALLATMAGMYAVYHGAEGLKRIADHIHTTAGMVAGKLTEFGYQQLNKNYFDTLRFKMPAGVKVTDLEKIAVENEINLRYIDHETVALSIDETTMFDDVVVLLDVFAQAAGKQVGEIKIIPGKQYFDVKFKRTSDFLTLDLFKKYRCESEMMRYIKRLERKDISLTHSMISLGSCTMKLNAATEMLPVTWIEFGGMHPFAPADQAVGYHQMFDELKNDLKEITGFADISLQPNSGAAGEYAGLMVIRNYHINRGQGHRNVALIPSSAHGTNPASAAFAGMEIIVVNCDDKGNIDINDLKAKAELHKDNLSCFMVTYPSTHGVFEEAIMEMTKIIHGFGGQVYMDGANMNAQVGLTNPATIGADVCHLNLHKTFAIPHGGGGPGVGPIGVAAHLVDFLPNHPVVKTGGDKGTTVAAAPYGSAGVMVISHAYIKMCGGQGLTEATKYAILNANYLKASLSKYYDILYTGTNGMVAHEMILNCAKFKDIGHITEADIAKRLMDYGYHAPTLSFPVHGTLMVEPTESESLQELDRFVQAMISIHDEIMEIKDGKADEFDNVLKNAPHTPAVITANEWNHSYSRQKAGFPLKWVGENKFWPTVGRIDDGYGDRNLVCSCAPIDAYRKEIEFTKVNL